MVEWPVSVCCLLFRWRIEKGEVCSLQCMLEYTLTKIPRMPSLLPCLTRARTRSIRQLQSYVILCAHAYAVGFYVYYLQGLSERDKHHQRTLCLPKFRHPGHHGVPYSKAILSTLNHDVLYGLQEAPQTWWVSYNNPPPPISEPHLLRPSCLTAVNIG